MQCYGLALILGVFGILSRRWIAGVIGTAFVAYATWRGQVTGVQEAGQIVELQACFVMGMLLSLVRSHLVRYRRIVLMSALWWGATLFFMGMTMTTLVICVPVAAIAFGESENKQLRRFSKHGDLSYGVYLWAWPIQQTLAWAVAGRLPYVFDLGVVSGLSLGCAYLSWRYVEAPAMAWKVRRSESVANVDQRPVWREAGGVAK